ncbi:MAG: hypothetical protein KY466_07565 [Gemmatimonadetes bacterium]|nr:hypothetical protein [Gemmatimonadota bacterium]
MTDYRFRVSDSYFIPNRGWMLRLKLLDGDFSPSMLQPGESLRLTGPRGEGRTVTVKGLSVTGGFQKKARVDAYREFDVVIPESEAMQDDQRVAIGWEAGPAS